MKKGHIGCGPIYLDGWVNIDISYAHKTDIRCDILNHDFGENEFDVIYLCHVFEHFSVQQGAYALTLFHKWLKPGGILRLAVPSLELAAQAYVGGSDMKFLYGSDFKGYYLHDTPCERFNFFMKEWEHKLTYDFPQLNLMLSNAGFRNIERKEANSTAIPGFEHDRFISESIYVECIK